MVDQDQDAHDPRFDTMTARLLRREALRHAAEELNTTSGPGLEAVLARISAEVTAEAACRQAAAAGKTEPGVPEAALAAKLPRQEMSSHGT